MKQMGRRELVTALSVGAGLSAYSRSAPASTPVGLTLVSPTQYGASTTSTDNTAALNAWLAALGATNQIGIIDAQYNFQGTLSVSNVLRIRIIQPLASRFSATEVPYGLVYTGAPNPTGVALQFTGVMIVELDHVTIDGNQNIGTIVDVEPGNGQTHLPGSYQHIGCVFRGCSTNGPGGGIGGIPSTGMCYHIGGSVQCAEFYWQDCFFVPNAPTSSSKTSGIGLQIDNQNSVDHTMIGGSAGPGNTGILLHGGKMQVIGAEFANNAAQDIANFGAILQIDNCWSEASNQFLYIGFSGSGHPPTGTPSIAATTIRNTNIASSPYNYSVSGGGPAVNQSDSASYRGIHCDKAWGLTLIGCTLETFGTSPSNPNQITTVYCYQPLTGFGNNVNFDWTNINSYSAIPGGSSPAWSKQFFSVQGVIFG